MCRSMCNGAGRDRKYLYARCESSVECQRERESAALVGLILLSISLIHVGESCGTFCNPFIVNSKNRSSGTKSMLYWCCLFFHPALHLNPTSFHPVCSPPSKPYRLTTLDL